MRRWTRPVTLVALATLALAASERASAQAACPDLDVTCHVGEGAGARGSLVDDTIDPVIDTVDPVVDDLLSGVEDVLNSGGPVDLPDPIGGGDGGGHVGGLPQVGDDPHGTPGPSEGGRGVGGGSRLGRVVHESAGPSVQIPSGAIADRRLDRTSGSDFGAALEGVARSLAIVLTLFGLAVAFVAIQDRLDRNDPRLVAAPVDSDVMEFA